MSANRGIVWNIVRAAACAAALFVLPNVATAASASPLSGLRQDIRVETVPAIPGLRFTFDGDLYVTGRDGAFVVPNALRAKAVRDMTMLPNRLRGGGEARFDRWYGGASNANANKPLKAAVDIYRRVAVSFTAQNNAVPPEEIQSVTVKRIDGLVLTLHAADLKKPLLLQTTRIVPLGGILVVKKLSYRILTVRIGGNNVVNRAQQSFVPADQRHVVVKLLFYTATFTSRDTIFRFPIGKSVKLVYPNGRVSTVPLNDGEATVPALPRGEYHVSVNALGYSPSSPLAITRDQHADLSVFSLVDALFVLLAVTSVALALLLARRPRLRRTALAKIRGR